MNSLCHLDENRPLILFLLIGIYSLFIPEISPNLSRSKRFLIFPHHSPTRHQFIGGIGIPAELSYESMIISYVLKAEFWLPWNASVYRENPFPPEYQNSLEINGRQWKRHIHSHQHSQNNLRWFIYKAIIERFNSYGYHGSECLLRAICEANYIEFHRDVNIFSQLLHIFFSPSTSEDHVNQQDGTIIDYKLAEKYGRDQQGKQNDNPCANIYACNLSILDLISEIMIVS